MKTKVQVMLMLMLMAGLSINGCSAEEEEYEEEIEAGEMQRALWGRRTINMGESFDVHKNELLNAKCVNYKRPPTVKLPNVGDISIIKNMSYGKMKDKLDVNAELELDVKGFKLAGAASYVDDNTSDEFSSTISVMVRVADGEVSLIDDSISVNENGEYEMVEEQVIYLNDLGRSAYMMTDRSRQAEKCGTNFIARKKFGATYMATLKIMWDNLTAKQAFDGSLEASYKDYFKIKGQVGMLLEEAKQNFNLEINISLRGGNAMALSEFLPENLTKCKPENYLDCLAVFDDAYDKAKEFRKLFVNEVHRLKAVADAQKASSEGEVEYNVDTLPIDYSWFYEYGVELGSYDRVYLNDGSDGTGLEPVHWAPYGVSGMELDSVLEKRAFMGKEYMDTKKLIARAEFLMENDYRLTTERKDDLRGFQRKAVEVLRLIGTRVGPCYVDLRTDANACLMSLEQYDTDREQEEYKLNKSLLVIPIETIGDWCHKYNLRLHSDDRLKELMLPLSARTTLNALFKETLNDQVPVISNGSPECGEGESTTCDYAFDDKSVSTNLIVAYDDSESGIAFGEGTVLQLHCSKIQEQLSGLRTLNLNKHDETGVRGDLPNISNIEPLLTIKGLSELKLNGHEIGTSIQFINKLEKIESLYLDDTGLTSLAGIDQLTDLYHLSLADNNIRRIGLASIGAGAADTLSGLELLETLDLSGNKTLVTIDLDRLVYLNSLKMTGVNKLRNFWSAMQSLNDNMDDWNTLVVDVNAPNICNPVNWRSFDQVQVNCI